MGTTGAGVTGRSENLEAQRMRAEFAELEEDQASGQVEQQVGVVAQASGNAEAAAVAGGVDAGGADVVDGVGAGEVVAVVGAATVVVVKVDDVACADAAAVVPVRTTWAQPVRLMVLV